MSRRQTRRASPTTDSFAQPGALIAASALSLVLAALLGGCAATGRAPSSSDDAWAYCSAVGTIDASDARYTGEAMPPAVAAGLRKAVGAPADAPLEVFARGGSWRCMGGKVYACAVGANLPCQEKADVSREPSMPIVRFCRQNPGADVVPAFVTGRATVFAWRCAGGAPAIARQIATPDPQGFLSNIWHEIPPPR